MRKTAMVVLVGMVAAVVAVLPAGAGTFDDVPDGAWYEDAVEWMVSTGITFGTGPREFSPDDFVTRAQMAAFLSRFGQAEGVSPSSGFADVPAGVWYEQSVDWLLSRGITTGTSATTYSPDAFVTRAQMAAFLWRLGGRTPSDAAISFADVPAASWYTEPVRWLTETGITVGTSPTTFSPDDLVTRAQMAVFLHRLAGEPVPGQVGMNRTASVPVRAGGGTIVDGDVGVTISGLSGDGYVRILRNGDHPSLAGSASPAIEIVVTQAEFTGPITVRMPLDAFDAETLTLTVHVLGASGTWEVLPTIIEDSVVGGIAYATFEVPAGSALGLAGADLSAASTSGQNRVVVQLSGTRPQGSIVMARANWSTGYFQAAVVRALLVEAGYVVNEPADLELPPSNFFTALGEGEVDLWANSWYPGHFSWWNNELRDGSLVGDHVEIVGELLLAGGLQGYLTNKTIADQYPGLTLDMIDRTPALVALYDAGDDTPGDGVVQIMGCQDDWTCSDIIDTQIDFAGWNNIEQTRAGYFAMVAEAVDRAINGVPFIVYAWSPSSTLARLVPGDNAIWLSVEAASVLDGSIIPEFNQRVDGIAVPAALGPGFCSADPCHTGWTAADIQISANSDFLAANPVAAALLEQIRIPIGDVVDQNQRYDSGENTTGDVNRHALAWITANRPTVDGWLANAAVAG